MANRRRYGGLLIAAGSVFLAAALFLAVYNFLDSRRAGSVSEQVLEELQDRAGNDALPGTSAPETGALPDYVTNPDMAMPTVEIDGNSYIGVLEIPSLELSLPVMSEWSYPNLRISPCRYGGSAYAGNLVIAAHNYSRHFGRLSTLEPGGKVVFTDVDGNTFYYRVAETGVIEPTAIEDVLGGDWALTLFTCTYGGQARVAVRCVSSGPE